MTARTCTVEGCGREYNARGLCKGHYERLRIWGDVRPEKSLDRNPTPIDWCRCTPPEPEPFLGGLFTECGRCRRGIPTTVDVQQFVVIQHHEATT